MYNVDECIELTGLGRNSIYNAINKGKLIASKFGSRTLILALNFVSFLTSL